MTFINNILNKKNPVKIIDSIFAIFLIFIVVVLFSQMNTLINSYMNSAVDEMTRTHEILMENKASQVNRIVFLEDYFRFIYQKKVPSEKNIEYEKVIEKKQLGHAFRYISNDDEAHNVIINFVGKNFLLDNSKLNGVSKGYSLKKEINAMQHLFSLLPLTNNDFNVESRIYYVSKSGMYATTTPSSNPTVDTIETTYERMINSSYFNNALKLSKPSKNNIVTAAYEGPNSEGKLITMYLPIIIDGDTVGVICIDFEVRKLGTLLNDSIESNVPSIYNWIDGNANIIASSITNISDNDKIIAEKVLSLTKNHTTGSFYSDFSYITYKKIKGEHGALFVTHSLPQILRSAYGTQIIFVIILLASFALSLIFSFLVIRKLIKEMHILQHSLEWKANHDSLTKILNRNGFYTKLEASLLRNKNLGLPISIIQIDLDKFKLINDTYGHFAGDVVLMHAAKIIKENIRSDDILGRLGGEEFCIFCLSIDLRESALLAERIRLAVSMTEIEITKDIKINISASFGVACNSDIGDYNINKIQAVADRRLYLAKNRGRNLVCSAG